MSDPERRDTPGPGLLLAVAAVLAYGSLYPFEIVYPAPAGEWRALLALRPADLHLGDVLANLLLFVPFGLLVGLRAGSRGRGLALAVALGLTLGVGLQIMQVFVAERVPSLWDAGWNTAGAAAGSMIPLRALRGPYHRWRPRSVFAAGLIVLWLAVATFPFVPTLDWQALKNALKPILLHPGVQPIALLAHIVGWAALAHLWRNGAQLPLPRAGPALALAATLAAQVLVVQRAPSLSGALGGLAGIGLALVPARAAHRAAGLLALLILSLVVSGLEPMVFRADPGPFHWLPLAGFLDGSLLHGIWVGLEKLFWYGLLVELMLFLAWPWRRVLATGTGLLGGLEWAQRWVAAPHVAEITDPLLFIALALLRARLSGGGLLAPQRLARQVRDEQ